MDNWAKSPFKRIVVPLDGSDLAEQSLPYARAVGPEAELILVHAVPPLEDERDWLRGLVFATVDEVQDRAKADAGRMMYRAAHRWLGERPKVSLEIRDGEPAETILRIAADKHADLIVVASHGRGAAKRLVFGSLADRIAHYAPVPVLIVRPRDAAVDLGPAEIGRVLVPLDGSDLAKGALPIAAAVAQELRVSIVLFQAIDPPSSAAADSLEEIAAALRDSGLQTSVELRVGSAFAAIADFSGPNDLVVMSSHGRSGLRRWVLGSVAEKLVRSGPAPVMIVPVAGRVTSEAAATRSAASETAMIA